MKDEIIITSNLIEAAERIFNMPVRIGISEDIAGLKDKVATPIFTNGVGLLKYGIKMNRFMRTKARYGKEGRIASFIKTMRKLYEDYL